jgi:hypothetical protein
MDLRKDSTAAERAPSAISTSKRPIDRGLIEEVVADLCRMSRVSTLDFSVKVGEFVFLKIFAGDMEALRTRGLKDTSFRKLSAHPKLPFSAATLWRAVAIFDLSQRFPGLLQMKHLGVAHMRAVLGLPADVQERLLRIAETERWTKDRIEERASFHRLKPQQKAGADRARNRRWQRQIEKLVSSCRSIETKGGAGGVDEARAKRLLDELLYLRSWCDQIVDSLRTPAEGTAASMGPSTEA